jgi:tripartite ATP-independent transporter DctP family solute receptor
LATLAGRPAVEKGGMMKIARSLAAVTAAGVFALAASARAQSVSLLIASGLPAEHSSTKAMEIFKAEVARRSHDSIAVELAPGERLGGPAELVQKLRAESIFATWVGASYFAQLVPEIEAVNLPFVFRNYDDVMRTIGGPVGKLIEAKVDAKGFVLLAWLELGARNVANAKRPLKTLDDLKGLKLYVSPAETFQATFRALGATPMRVPTNEIYNLLRQGDLDGVEVSYSIMNGYKYYENMKYVSDTNHVLVANKKAFNRLTPEQQKTIKDVAKLVAIQQRKMADEADAAAFMSLKDAGAQFDPIPPKTRVAMRKATAGVVDRLKMAIGAELVDRVIAEADRRAVNSAAREKR